MNDTLEGNLPICAHCGTRCGVPRRSIDDSLIFAATCEAGMIADLDRYGNTHLTLPGHDQTFERPDVDAAKRALEQARGGTAPNWDDVMVYVSTDAVRFDILGPGASSWLVSGDSIEPIERRTKDAFEKAYRLICERQHRPYGGEPPTMIIYDYDTRIVEQAILPADLDPRWLPRRIVRKCCVYKSCGNASLYLDAGFNRQTGIFDYAYRRDTNNDLYFGPTSDVPSLIGSLNNRLMWPVREPESDSR